MKTFRVQFKDGNERLYEARDISVLVMYLHRVLNNDVHFREDVKYSVNDIVRIVEVEEEI